MAVEADADAYDVLMDLIDGGRAKEVVWKASDPFHSFEDYAEMDETAAEYRQLFDDVVGDVTGTLGRPRYVGERARPDFPAWSPAVHLAVWDVDGRGAYVAVHHARPDDPFELRLGVR